MKTGIIGIICFSLSFLQLLSQEKEQQLPTWEKGWLDIHHISTGRGDAAFFVFPDATTLLIDAGDMSETHPRTLSARNTKRLPNTTRSAPEWIVEYIKQFSPTNRPPRLDYALITHYHDDHFGEMDATRKMFDKGNYALTGITEVGHHIPIRTLLDRGSEYPINLRDKKIQEELERQGESAAISTLKNYWSFADYQSKTNSMLHATLEAGKLNQLHLVHAPMDFPDFSIRNIAVNGNVWTGVGETFYSLFKTGDSPGENPLSTSIKISYGQFDYFTGGDIKGVNDYGDADFESIESHIAPIVGPVDIATLNHHGNRDSQNKYYVRSLRPRIWIGQSWSSDHPDNNVLRRLLSEDLYPGERDLFSTAMLQPNRDVIGNLLNNYKSQQGHVVVRVYNNGDTYDIFVLNDSSEKREVIAKFGPYKSR